VRIRELSLRPFRNFASIHLHIEANHTLIFGPNGRGKSNILEAISYLSIGKSVRGAKDHQAVPHDGDYFDIRANCEEGRHEQRIRIFYGKKEGKKAFLDDNPLARVSDILGHFRTVHFSPEDVSLVLRFPAQRRRILDILISQYSATYLRDLQLYQRVLNQRNHLLRTAKRSSNGVMSDETISPWDAQLAELGARIRSMRLTALEILGKPFVQYYARFSPGGEEASIDYKGIRDQGTDLEAALLEELERKRPQELQAGHTLCGPHRDDVSFVLNGQSAEIYASEGQLKTILIAWKLAEGRYLEQCCGQQPVILLDDVFSELDHDRIGVLLEIVDEFEQVVVTTPQKPEARLVGCFEQIRLEK
jgi:DNA replication and repair protein RecF